MTDDSYFVLLFSLFLIGCNSFISTEENEKSPAKLIEQLYTVNDIQDCFRLAGEIYLKGDICTEDSCDKFKKIIIALNMNKIINHLRLAIRSSKENIPVLKLNIATPICSTSNLIAWYTTKEIKPTIKSQINRLIIDSGWEKIGLELDRDRNKNICAWVKNDRHVGFAIGYVFQGQTSRYYPDFIIKFTDNRFIILEIKGRIYEKDFSKCQAVEEWIKAVNADGNFGYWEFVFWNKTDNIYDHLKMPTN